MTRRSCRPADAELRRATLAASEGDVADARRNAENAIDHASWTIIGTPPAPPTGRRGAREALDDPWSGVEFHGG